MCMRIFFFNDTATTEIYTLSLHDALPISDTLYWGRREDYRGVYMGEMNALGQASGHGIYRGRNGFNYEGHWKNDKDRKSTRLNSSHANISYAVFCLKKKKK